MKACDYPDVEDCNDDCNNCHPAYPGSLGIQAISAGTEICDNQDNDCNDDTGDGSGEQAPLNSKQQGICFETTKSCGDDCELGGDCWQDNFPEEYSLEEQCDFIDHDCDGKPNTQTNGDNEETVLDGCQIGGSSGLPFDAGNLYVDNWVPGEGGAQIPDEGNLPTNYIDATIVSIQQELYETGNNNGGLPLCHNFGAGKICVCKNGDYWRDENGNGNVDYVVNYVGRTKEVSAFIIGGNVLKNGDENVQCPLE